MAQVQVIDEGNIIEIIQGRDLTVVLPVENNIEIQQLKFIQLSDVPNSYKDASGKTLRVNDTADGIIFGKTYDTFLSLDDTPSTYENSSGQLVVVNSSGTGLRFVNYTNADINIEYFTQLGDVPNSYKDKAGQIVAVDNTESGLNFISKDTIIPNQENVTAGSYRYPVIAVNEKGIITSIIEGKPFEFDSFKENQLLIGDGTTTPAQLDLGTSYQVLMTSTEDDKNPKWTYLDRLMDNTGRNLLLVSNKSTVDTGVLSIINSQSNILLQPSSQQTIVLGTEHDTKLSRNLIFPENSNIQSLNGLEINPYTGTVGITGVDAGTYAERLQENDFITRKWYENKQEEKPVLVKSSTQVITKNTVSFDLHTGARAMEINLDVSSQFNKDAKLRVVDSLNQVLFDPEDSPYLDYSDLKIFLNIESQSDTYKINVQVMNYTTGQATVFMSYFEGRN